MRPILPLLPLLALKMSRTMLRCQIKRQKKTDPKEPYSQNLSENQETIQMPTNETTRGTTCQQLFNLCP
jgi:hypothetical protein